MSLNGVSRVKVVLSLTDNVVVDGYHDDWQLIVELTIDLEKKRAL